MVSIFSVIFSHHLLQRELCPFLINAYCTPSFPSYFSSTFFSPYLINAYCEAIFSVIFSHHLSGGIHSSALSYQMRIDHPLFRHFFRDFPFALPNNCVVRVHLFRHFCPPSFTGALCPFLINAYCPPSFPSFFSLFSFPLSNKCVLCIHLFRHFFPTIFSGGCPLCLS